MREMRLTYIDVSFKVIWVRDVIHHVLLMVGFSIHAELLLVILLLDDS